MSGPSRKRPDRGPTQRRVRRWTDHEIGELEAMAHLTVDEVADILGRSRSSIASMRHQMRHRKVGTSTQPWTEDDLDFVRATTSFTAAQVAEHLGRTYSAVASIRFVLRQSEGADFRGDDDGQKNPHDVGTRRLLARTCLGCGLLLDAIWYHRDGARRWKSRCLRCNNKERAPRHRSDRDKENAQQQARRKLLGRVTRERATRHGYPWLESDHDVLRDTSLSVLDKSFQLGRTYNAVLRACSLNGYTSRVGKGDPMKGIWVIANPNEVAA